jgi:hypothetical protein
VVLTRLPDHAGEVGAVAEEVLDLGDAEDVGVDGVVDEDLGDVVDGGGVDGEGIGDAAVVEGRDVESDFVKTV